MNTTFETINHNRSFPAKIFVTQINQCDFHWHYDYELFLVLKGTVNVYSNLEPAMLSAGDLFLFNSCFVHGIQRTAADNLCLCIQFDPKIFCSDLGESFRHYFYLNSTSRMYPPRKEIAYFRRRMADLALTCMNQTETSAMRTYSQLLSLTADLIDYVQYDVRRLPVGSEDLPINETYDEIRRYIEEHIDADRLIPSLCHHIGMSEKSLYRYLKSILGLTAKEYVDVIKVEKACTMLREEDKPLAIVWQSCGYTSEVSFFRNFKKQIGCTPTEYRRGLSPTGPGTDGGDYLEFDLGEALHLLLTFSREETGENEKKQ